MSGTGADGRPEARAVSHHIVIVTPYYWPILTAATHLMKALAEGLAEAGHRVSVLTNGAPAGGPAEPDGPLLKGRVHRAWNPFVRRLGVLAKCLDYSWFSVFFLFRGLALRKVDVIFVASNPPLAGLPAALLAWVKGAKLVYNLQDIFPDSAVVAGLLPAGGRAYRVLRKAEEVTYRVSDLVVSISPSFSEYVQRLAPGTPVATIPNWVDTDLVRPMEAAEDPSISGFRQGGAFVVQYAGTIGFMQSLETVLQAAELLVEHPDIQFVFIGDGNAKQAMEAQARERKLANCTFLPLQPLHRVPSVYNACDVGVIPLKAGAAQIAVPSKTWNYLAAGRPVVGCVEADSPLAEAIRESRSGAVVPPGDPAALARVLLEYRDDPDRLQAEGHRGREYAEANLSCRAAIRRYLLTFNQLLEESA